jgi:hypothetical protein
MKKKQFVYTKKVVYDILTDLSDKISGLKTVKEVREYLTSELPKHKPSGRGRRIGTTNLDLAKLQSLVTEKAEIISGNDGKFLAGMVASAWNVSLAGGSNSLLQGESVRKLIESGKLTMPERFSFPVRQKRQRQTEEAAQL